MRLRQFKDTPSVPKGNCLFDSLIKITGLKIIAIELRNKLLDSPALADCGDPNGACLILSSQNEYVDADTVYIYPALIKEIYAFTFTVGIEFGTCIIETTKKNEYIHLYLKLLHFTPYLPTEESATTAQLPDTSRLSIPAGEECDPIGVVGGSSAEGAGKAAERTADLPPRHHGALTRYLTAEARPTYATPPWAREADIEERFTAIQQLDEQPFACRDNLIYVLSTDLFTGTEILEALIERRYLSEDELTSTRREIGDI